MSKHRERYPAHSTILDAAAPLQETPVSAGPGCVGHHPDTPVCRGKGCGRLCEDCHRQLARHLTELPGVVSWLHVNLPAGDTPLGERVSGSREAPTPLRLDVLEMIGPSIGDTLPDVDQALQLEGGLDHIPDTLEAWARTISESRPCARPAERDVHTLCRWFQREQLPWIVEQEWVDEFLDQMHRLMRQASQVAPWRAEHLRDRQEPCSHCAVLALVQHVAEGRVVCEERLGGCGRARKVTKYEWNTRHLRTKPRAAS